MDWIVAGWCALLPTNCIPILSEMKGIRRFLPVKHRLSVCSLPNNTSTPVCDWAYISWSTRAIHWKHVAAIINFQYTRNISNNWNYIPRKRDTQDGFRTLYYRGRQYAIARWQLERKQNKKLGTSLGLALRYQKNLPIDLNYHTTFSDYGSFGLHRDVQLFRQPGYWSCNLDRAAPKHEKSWTILQTLWKS